MNMWINLPAGLDAVACALAQQAGVDYLPGGIFPCRDR